MKTTHLIKSVLLILSAIIWSTPLLAATSAKPKTITNQALINSTAKIIEQYTKPGWFAGSVVIYKQDKVIYDKSFGLADIENNIKNTSSTKIRIGSINKHFTAVLIMQKVQAGKLSLDDTLDTFDLGYKGIAKQITIRQLLTHTSGFADIFTREYFNTYRELKDINAKLPLLMDKPLLSKPGEKHSYSNYGYVVLGAILEKVENKPFAEILQQNILKPINANNTQYALTDQVTGKAKSYHFSPLGEKLDQTANLENVTPDGGMYSTPHDLALFFANVFYSEKLLNNPTKALLTNKYQATDKPWQHFLTNPKTHWRSYGGGPGVSAAAEILIADRVMVFVLANTDRLVAEYISQRIVDVYKGKHYPKVQLPVNVFAKKLLDAKGNDFFITDAENTLTKAGYTNFHHRELNRLGMALYRADKLPQAIAVFIVNANIFPKEPNTWDSLALAYEKHGDKTNAIKYYKKTLSMDENFTSAKEGLERLE